MDRESFRALLSQNIQTATEKSGLSLSAVARNAGVAKSTFFAIINGQSSPTADTLLQIAAALHTAPWRLLKPPRK